MHTLLRKQEQHGVTLLLTLLCFSYPKLRLINAKTVIWINESTQKKRFNDKKKKKKNLPNLRCIFLTVIKRAYFWRLQSKDYISGWFSGTGCRYTCILIIRKSDVLHFYLYQVSVGVLLEKESLFDFTFNKVLFNTSRFVYDS